MNFKLYSCPRLRYLHSLDAAGAEITRLRVDRSWSQAKLAHEPGYTERYIGQLERGTKSPTLRTLADLAKAFTVEVSAIIRS